MPTRAKAFQRKGTTASNNDENYFYSKSYHDRIHLPVTESDAAIDHERHLPPIVPQKIDLSGYRSRPPASNRIHSSSKPDWMSNKTLHKSFRKETKPYVHLLLVQVINNIETECSYSVDDNTFWKNNYQKSKHDTEKAREIIYDYLVEKKPMEFISAIVDNQPLRVQTSVIRELLSLFPTGHIYFNRKRIAKISKRSLYDYQLHVNPSLLKNVKEIVLRMSRTDVNTLAFMMIHIFHLWEFSSTPHITQIMIADVYGPWIIKFEEEPFISSIGGAQTCAGLILMAIMDSTDAIFWGNLTMMEVGRLFQNVTPFERKRYSRKQATVNLLGLADIDRQSYRPSHMLTKFSFVNYRPISEDSFLDSNMFRSDKKSSRQNSSLIYSSSQVSAVSPKSTRVNYAFKIPKHMDRTESIGLNPSTKEHSDEETSSEILRDLLSGSSPKTSVKNKSQNNQK